MRLTIKSLVLLCFLLIGNNGLICQEKEAIVDSMINWLAEKLEKENLTDTAAFSLNASIGDLLGKKNEPTRAINHLQKSLVLGTRLNYNDSLQFIDVLNDLAYNLRKINQVRTAEKYIRSHIDNTIKDWRYVKLCFYYAECLELLGDVSLAQLHLERALNISEEINNERYISRSLARLSRVYVITNSLDNTILLNKKLEQYQYLPRKDQLKVVELNIAIVYKNNKLYKEAIRICDNIINWGVLNEKINYESIGKLTKAVCLTGIGSYNQSKRIYLNVIKTNPSQNLTYENLAEVYYLLEDYDSAIYYIEIALEKEEIFLPENVLKEEFKKEILRFPYKEDILLLFHDLAKAYFSKAVKDDDTEFFSLSSNLFQLLDEIIDEVRFSTTEQQSQHFWREQVKPIYDDAIELAHSTNSYDKAFYFAEKSKAILLLDALLKNTTKVKGEIPDSLLEQEFIIKEELFELDLQLTSADTEVKDSLNDALLKKRLELGNLIQTMSLIAPNYINTRYEPPLANLEQLKNRMAADETIINFVWTEDFLFRFVIDKEDSKLKKIPLSEEFKHDLRFLIKHLKEPISKKQAFTELNGISNKVFEVLLADAELKNEHLVILPDGLINYLPFEALVVNLDYENPQYLLENKIINYGFSVNTTYATYTKNNSRDIIAFAPNDYKREMKLAKLSFSDFELDPILKSGSKLLSNESASKEAMLSNFKSKKIIHIYSHAEANDQKYPYPWIAAQDDLIFLPEIYNTSSSADLVVLSACETNLGKEVEGEGVISLARGFFHSGSKSVLASLWKVNDKSNSEIVHHFYQYVKKGNSKAEALRLSKLDYIKNHMIESKSPYYWAGLVYIGEDGDLNINAWSYRKWLFLLLGFIALLLLFYWVRNR